MEMENGWQESAGFEQQDATISNPHPVNQDTVSVDDLIYWMGDLYVKFVNQKRFISILQAQQTDVSKFHELLKNLEETKLASNGLRSEVNSLKEENSRIKQESDSFRITVTSVREENNSLRDEINKLHQIVNLLTGEKQVLQGAVNENNSLKQQLNEARQEFINERAVNNDLRNQLLVLNETLVKKFDKIHELEQEVFLKSQVKETRKKIEK